MCNNFFICLFVLFGFTLFFVFACSFVFFCFLDLLFLLLRFHLFDGFLDLFFAFAFSFVCFCFLELFIFLLLFVVAFFALFLHFCYFQDSQS